MSIGELHLLMGNAADLDEVIALERATEFAPHWRRDTYLEMLAAAEPEEWGKAQRVLFVAKTSGRLVGFAVILLEPRLPGCGCADEERTVELESIVVAAAARRNGIGRTLLQQLQDWSRSEGATEFVLEVRASNYAVGFYRALGFEQTGRRKNYYSHPVEDALLLRLPLR